MTTIDLTAEDEAELAEDTEAIQRGLSNIRAEAVGIGERLAKRKATLPHGKFLRWIEAKFGFTGQTARNLMNLAVLAKAKPVLDLPIDLSGLYVLAAPNTPETAVDEVIAIAQTKKVAKKRVKAIVAKHSPPKAKDSAPPLTKEAVSARVKVLEAELKKELEPKDLEAEFNKEKEFAKEAARARESKSRLPPITTRVFRERHAAALKRLNAVVTKPPRDLLEAVRTIEADMAITFDRWLP
jgi:hypothetical protein